VSHLEILQQFGANSAGTFEASQNHNESFGITQPERLVKFSQSENLWQSFPMTIARESQRLSVTGSFAKSNLAKLSH
jgi:hypothetical protein